MDEDAVIYSLSVDETKVQFPKQLREFIQQYQGDKENFYFKRLLQVQQCIFRGHEVDEEWLDLFVLAKQQLTNVQKKKYNYNKIKGNIRGRRNKIIQSNKCQNCNYVLHNNSKCQNCGYEVEVEKSSYQYPTIPPLDKFDLFMKYFMGQSSIPVFVVNFVNNILQTSTKQTFRELVFTKEEVPMVEIDFPFIPPMFTFTRFEVGKHNQLILDEYQHKKIMFPKYSFYDFKRLMIKYRPTSVSWQNSSYLPRDFIFTKSVYVKLYNIPMIEIIPRDYEILKQEYENLLNKDLGRKNRIPIQNFITTFFYEKMTQYIPNILGSIKCVKDLKDII